jgi:hypothetical protein
MVCVMIASAHVVCAHSVLILFISVTPSVVVTPQPVPVVADVPPKATPLTPQDVPKEVPQSEPIVLGPPKAQAAVSPIPSSPLRSPEAASKAQTITTILSM